MMNEEELKEMVKEIKEYINEKGYNEKVKVTDSNIIFIGDTDRVFSIVNNIENNIKNIENNI